MVKKLMDCKPLATVLVEKKILLSEKLLASLNRKIMDSLIKINPKAKFINYNDLMMVLTIKV
jgi:hypothetical protein